MQDNREYYKLPESLKLEEFINRIDDMLTTHYKLSSIGVKQPTMLEELEAEIKLRAEIKIEENDTDEKRSNKFMAAIDQRIAILSRELEEIQEKLNHLKSKYSLEELGDEDVERYRQTLEMPSKELLIKYLQARFSVSAISRLYGVSTCPVNKWLVKYNINFADYKQAPSKEELLALFKEKNQQDVAKQYEVSCHIVRKWLREYDIESVRNLNKAIQPKKQELIKLLRETSMDKICKEYNISIYRLRQLIVEYEIDRIPLRKHLVKSFNSYGTGQRVADHYKVTITVLTGWLKSYGLTVGQLSNFRPVEIKVYMTSEDESIIHAFTSLKEAYEYTGICRKTINQYSESKKVYKGFTFDVKT